jgi:hypothetical protein
MRRTHKRKRTSRVKRHGKRHRSMYKKMFGGEKTVPLATKLSDLYVAADRNNSNIHKEIFRQMSHLEDDARVEAYLNEFIANPASKIGIQEYDIARYRDSFTAVRNHLFNGRGISFRGGKYVEVITPDPSQPFNCPLTGLRMTDPVVDRGGVSYERTALTAWINEHHTNPITGQPMLVTHMITNRALREVIESTPVAAPA